MRQQSARARPEEQGGYRNTDALFLGCDSNQQGLGLKNREATETPTHCSWDATAISRDQILRPGMLWKHSLHYALSYQRKEMTWCTFTFLDPQK
jgi:hypothetical protein